MELIEEMAEALKDAQRYVGIYAHADNVARRLNDNFAYLIDKYSAVVEMMNVSKKREKGRDMDRKTKRLPDPSDVRDNLIAGCCQDCPNYVADGECNDHECFVWVIFGIIDEVENA